MKTLILAAVLTFAADSELVSIGKSVSLAKGESAREVVVIGGHAEISGDVKNSVVVVGGQARVNGKVGDEVVGIGGVVLGPDADVKGDVVSIGAPIIADPKAKIGGNRTAVAVGNFALPASGWLVDGPLKLRTIPHDNIWAWGFALSMVLMYVVAAVLAPGPVAAAAAATRAQPATALLAGLLALGLAGPTLLLLVVSVAGIVVIPFLLAIAAAGLIVGKAGLYQTLGSRFNLEGPAAVALGGLLFTLPLAVPGLGLLAWGLTTAWGFGAAVMAAAEMLKNENKTLKEKTMTTEAAVLPAPAPTVKLDLPRATFGQRLAATLLDFVFCSVLAGITPFLVLGPAIWAVYQVGLWTWKGTTLGGIVIGIRGVRGDGRPMDFTVALVRHLASYFSAAAAGLGFLWAAWDPESQTWHDKIAGTYVVVTPKGEPLV